MPLVIALVSATNSHRHVDCSAILSFVLFPVFLIKRMTCYGFLLVKALLVSMNHRKQHEIVQLDLKYVV